MGAAENKKLMQDIFSEMAKGNPQPLVESLADNVRWTITGSTKWSRTFEGKGDVLTKLLGPLGTLIEGPVKLVAHRFIAEDDFVVFEARGDNMTKTGVPYNNTYCFVCRLADGKIQELNEYADTDLIVKTFG